MSISAVKKVDGSIWMVHGDASRVMEEGDVLVEIESLDDLPDARYQSCWTVSNGQISVDLSLARAQKMAAIRAERDQKLEETDKDWMIAMSKGQDVTALNAKKQALRDLPASAQTDLNAKRAISTIDAYEPEWP